MACCFTIRRLSSTFFNRRCRLIEQVRSDFERVDKFRLLVHSGAVTYRAPDVANRFKPAADYYYLTGYDEPNCTLDISCSGNESHTSIYIPHRSGAELKFEGPYETERLAIRDGLSVRPAAQLGEESGSGGSLNLTSGFPCTSGGDLRPTVQRLRLVKDELERKAIRTSCKLLSDVMNGIMARPMPFGSEREIEVELERGVRSRGAELAFIPVVGKGANCARSLHYQRNCDSVHKGETVLLDAGCEHEQYCSDISRTFENGMCAGKTRAAFRVLYDIVNDVQNRLIQLVRTERPGLQQLYLAMLSELLDTLHREGVLAVEPMLSVAMELCPHDVGHHMGLDVHDCLLGCRKAARLEAGNVVTCEPGLYINKDCALVREEFRGHAIRIEDDLLIGEKDVEVLTHQCKK